MMLNPFWGQRRVEKNQREIKTFYYWQLNHSRLFWILGRSERANIATFTPQWGWGADEWQTKICFSIHFLKCWQKNCIGNEHFWFIEDRRQKLGKRSYHLQHLLITALWKSIWKPWTYEVQAPVDSFESHEDLNCTDEEFCRNFNERNPWYLSYSELLWSKEGS